MASVARLERANPPGPTGEIGALVRLPEGESAKVETGALGRVEAVSAGTDRLAGRTNDNTVGARLADPVRFRRAGWRTLRRRGSETAGRVVGPVDSREWGQGFDE